MKSAICVLNAGSSSIKFSLFEEGDDDLDLYLRGQIESIGVAPRFAARDRDDNPLHEQRWDSGDIDHAGALDFLSEFLRKQLRNSELAAVGHRVVHGGMAYSDPVRVDAEVLAEVAQQPDQGLADRPRAHDMDMLAVLPHRDPLPFSRGSPPGRASALPLPLRVSSPSSRTLVRRRLLPLGRPPHWIRPKG